MDKILTLEFSGLPPTLNQMYRNSVTHRYKRPEVTDWQEEIADLMTEHYPAECPPYTGRVSVSIIFTVSDRRAWDIDNRVKALLDCLEMGGIIANDNQIDKLTVTRHKGKKNSTRITLMEYKGEEYQCVR